MQHHSEKPNSESCDKGQQLVKIFIQSTVRP